MGIEQLQLIAIENIDPNPHQPRNEFCEEELSSLAASIRSVGVIHPPVARSVEGGRFQLISGERRLRAARLAGLAKIPLIVRAHSEEKSAEAALIENVQRVDLNPMEIARSLQHLANRFGLTQEELAGRVGKQRSTVANYLRLLGLPVEVQQSLARREVTMGHAKVVLAVKGEVAQRQFWRRLLEEGMTVRQAERWVAQHMSERSCRPIDSAKRVFLDDLQRRLEQAFGRRVRLSEGRGESGSISFEYRDYEDLDCLLREWGVEAQC